MEHSESAERRKFSIKGLFAHAWDVIDPGADRLTDWMCEVGLDVLCLAGSYHSGWFVHPHSKLHRLFMTEGSAVYFHPQESLYAGTCLRPRVARLSERTDCLAIAAEAAKQKNLRLVSWTVGVHNTYLGQLYPECTQQNVYGDSLPHSLSIGHDATREYLKALSRDLATNYPMYGIQLEGFGWMGIRHSHHHERDLTELTPLEQQLMALCFNPHTVARAEKVGIDVGLVRVIVKRILDAAFAEAPDRPLGHPQTMSELEATHPELQRYNGFLQGLANSLVVEIKQDSLKGTTCKLYSQQKFVPELGGTFDGYAVWAYGKRSSEIEQIVTEGHSLFPADWPGEYHCYLRLGMGVPGTERELIEMVQTVKRCGSTGPIFYNYSEAPPRMLQWIAAAIKDQ